MAMSFDQIFAADPANPSNVASNAAVLIYAPGDATKTPLTITDPSGGPLANPVIVNANGFGSAFMHATLDRVAWDGGGFSGFFTSYEGMKNEAIAAREAAVSAESAATTAEAAATDAAEAATTAVESTVATLTSTFATYASLAKNPDTLISGAVTVDGSDYVTTAAVEWPDGTPGTLTITSRDASGAVLAYSITYGSPVTKTFTQPTITRNANGAATNVPKIVVT